MFVLLECSWNFNIRTEILTVSKVNVACNSQSIIKDLQDQLQGSLADMTVGLMK